MHICVALNVCHSMHMEVRRGQFAGVNFILLPGGFWGANSGHQLGGRYSLTYWAILPAQEVSFKMLVHKSQARWHLEVESVKERCEESLGGWVKVPGREEPEKAVWTVVKEIRASERGQQRWRQLRGTEREGSQGRHGDDPSQIYKPSFKVIKM